MRIASSQTIQFFLLFAFFSGVLPLLAQEDTESIFLENATIHTMSGKAPFVGSVLVVDGKIKQVGANLKPPKQAKKYDLRGFHLTPGLIDSRSKAWLTPAAAKDKGTRADLDVEFAIDPWSEDWRELASQGITSVFVQPASGGTLGGYGSVLRVGPLDSVKTIVLKSKVGIQSSLGLTGTSQARYAEVSAFEKQLEAAKKELDKEKDADKPPKPRAGKNKESAKKGGDKKETEEDQEKVAPEKQKDDNKSKAAAKKSEDDKKKDPLREALKRVLKKEVPLHIEVHRADVLQRVLKLAEKYKFRLVLDGLSKVDRVSQELRDSNRPMVIGPFIETGTVPSYRKDASRDWFAEVVAEEGRLWAISGFPANNGIESRLLRTQAAMAIRHGASRESTLQALTINPARMLDVADKIGSIEAGKHADIAVFAGEPLNPATPVRLVLSNGKVTYDAKIEADDSAKRSPKAKTAELEESLTELPRRLPNRYAIQSSRILGENGELSPGFLVIDDGRLAIAKRKPKNTPVFNLGDHVITSGLVNAWTTLGQQATIWDNNESDSSHMRAIDGIDPSGEAVEKMLAGGFIHQVIAPPVGNTSSGVAGHLRLGSEDYVGHPAVAGQFVFAGSARSANRFPVALASQITMVNSMLEGKLPESNFYLTESLADAIAKEKLDNLTLLKGGKRKTILLADTETEVKSAIALAKRYKLSGSIASTRIFQVGPEQMAALAKEIKEAGLGVIVGEINPADFDQVLRQYVTLDQAGVPLSLAGNSAERIRLSATLLVSAGVSPKSVLGAMTHSGASQVGVKDTSLSKGNRADFVVWDGHPLDLSTKPVHVIVDGNHVSKK